MTPQDASVLEQMETGRMDANRQQDTAIGELTRALQRETETVSDLREALLRQRAGVAQDSAELVNQSCDDIARLLVAIEAARRHRAMRIESLSPDAGITLESLERWLGPELPADFAEARATLRREAEATAREAGINRSVLSRTVEAGEAFLQALFAGTNGPDPVYRPGERREEDAAGFLLDRKA